MSRPLEPGRRDAVLDQVIGYVAEHGLTGLTLRKLATALGFSTNVISYQFGSKQGLIEAALMRSRTEQRAVYERLLAADPQANAAQGFAAIWYWWLDDPKHIAYSRMSIETLLEEAAPAPEARAGALPYWVDYFTSWLERDGHQRDAAVDLATLLLSVQTGLLTDVISGGDLERITRAMHRFAEVLTAPAPTSQTQAPAHVPTDSRDPHRDLRHRSKEIQ